MKLLPHKDITSFSFGKWMGGFVLNEFEPQLRNKIRPSIAYLERKRFSDWAIFLWEEATPENIASFEKL